MTPKNKLSNPYYFIKNNTIFNISSANNTNDSCGKHYVTYTTDPDITVSAGSTYVDLHGDYVKATTDKTGVVSTGIVDSDVSSKTFPFFKVEGTVDGEAGKQSYYFWLDDDIEDGDVVQAVENEDDVVKFMKSVHSDDPTRESEPVDFAKYYVDTVKNKIAMSIVNGKTFDAVKKGYPQYLFAKEDDEIKIEGKTVTVTGVTASYEPETLPIIAEEDLSETIYALINAMVVKYADSLLKNIEKKIDDEKDNLVTDENTVSI